MKVLIIGSGCVGLSIAYNLLKKVPSIKIIVIDRFNIPSKGTSLKNSGVLHAGLYYPPDSEKSKLCINGHEKLKKLSLDNQLPLKECGKLIIPTNNEQENNLFKLHENAISCNRGVKIIDYKEAKIIQPNVKKTNLYLWSPKTSIFSPRKILNYFYEKLLEEGVEFIKAKVEKIDNEKKFLTITDNTKIYFDYLFNCAGPGSLNLYKRTISKPISLTILPVLGQYGVIPKKNILKTNLYPVPEPNLPFLGIHITPMINGDILIGPNAVPIFKKDTQGYDINDFLSTIPNLINHSKLFTMNSQNYRKHALSELSFNLREKFKNEIPKFINLKESEKKSIYMAKNTFGIRPQLYDFKKNKLVNDFLYDVQENIVHIINAVSPAFTSCLALSEKMIDLIL